MAYQYDADVMSIYFEGHYNIEISDGESGDRDHEAIHARGRRVAYLLNSCNADLVREVERLQAQNAELSERIASTCGCSMPLFTETT